MKREFIRGTVYIVRPELGKNIIKKDIKNIAETGFNIVTLWPALHWDVIKKRADFRWLDFAVNEFGKNNVKVIIELMGQYCAMEYSPDWMIKDELKIKDFDGNIYKTNVHDLNFNHPEVRKMIDNYIEIVVNHYKDNPVVWGYDIYNEHHFESFDKYTMNEFKQWLENKYKNIKTLNRAWSRNFSSFSEVTLDIRYWHSIKSKVDWEMFKYDNLANNLRRWIKKLKSIDSTKPVVADNELAMIIYDKRDTKYVDDWKTAEATDIYGTTWYPKSSPKNLPWLWGLMFDFFRSTTKNKDYVLSELQTNNYSTTRNRGVSNKDDIKIWMWRALSFNAKGITFWKWAPFIKAQQLGGRGLVNIDRKLSERAFAASEVNNIIKKYENIFMNSKILSSSIAILYDRENKKFVDTLVELGNRKEVPHIADLSIYGWYKALYDIDIHPEFINEEELKTDILNNYKVLIIPFNFIIDKEEAEKIKEFVSNGGVVISEFRLGLSHRDELTYLTIPGEGLDKVFGFRENELRGLTNSEIFIPELNIKIPSGYFSQDIKIYNNSEIIGRFTDDNKVAIVKNKYGKGYTYYFATSVGESYYKNNISLHLFLKNYIYTILKDNLPYYILSKEGEVDNILHKSKNYYILYSFNFDKRKISETLKLNIKEKIESIVDITSNEKVSFEKTTNNTILINLSIAKYSSKVLFIKISE